MTDSILKGPDVSSWQGGAVDWAAVKGAGASFAGTKCSEGVGYVDPTFGRNWAAIADAGLVRIAYHYARPSLGNSPEGEAEWFVHCLGSLHAADIAAVDVEENTSVDVAAWTLDWLRRAEQLLGWPPLVYTFLAYAARFAGAPELGRYPLWLAAYGAEMPPSPPPWTTYALWQHTATASYPGITGTCDESLIHRDLAGLKALGKPAAAAPVQPAAAPGAHRPVKWLIARTMMLRRDPHHDDIYDPAQLVHKGAVLDQVGPEVGGWIEVTAGARRGWILKSNCTKL